MGWPEAFAIVGTAWAFAFMIVGIVYGAYKGAVEFDKQ